MEQQKSVAEMSAEELEQAYKQKRQEEARKRTEKKEAYESIRVDVVNRISTRVRQVTEDVKALFSFVQGETKAFKAIMTEYGQLKRDDQMSFTLSDDSFKIEVKANKIKKFDERADIAATRLLEFLSEWINDRQKGTNDPMYQLAMTLLERNRDGDLDYKSISKLYAMEDDFASDEYSEIMQLFKESNVINGTAINYYFWERNERGIWLKIEPSFNKM